MSYLKWVCASVLLAASIAATGNPQSAKSLAQSVFSRPTNEGRIAEMNFVLTDDAGRTRSRTAALVHSDKPDAVRIAIFFTAPASIANTAFLSHDYKALTDQTWLFLPATDRVRRLPSSDRGDSFMGTDLSYGDVKDNFKFQLDEWEFSGGADAFRDGERVLQLAGKATATAAQETGYGAFDALIDPVTLFPKEVTYKDIDGDLFKKVRVLELEEIAGAWTATAFTIENLQTGHATAVTLRKVRYEPDLDDALLDADFLDEGAPEL